MIKIKRGLDLPLAGAPQAQISDGAAVRHVAVLGPDYPGLKPTMAVGEGDTVKLGQVLFSDKMLPAIKYTAPGAGKVVAVNRGAKRVLISVEIELSGDAKQTFKAYGKDALAQLGRADVVAQLTESGLWTAIRTRPFGKVPNPATTPKAIFVSAMDTNPLAADPATILADQAQAFGAGLTVLGKLSDGKVFVGKAPKAYIPGCEQNHVEVRSFAGPHPAGLVGTHIHFLSPVSAQHVVWHVGYQDVAAIGKLFLTGELDVGRIVSLAGPQVKKPRYVRTRLGADLSQLTAGELKDGETRVISGSPLSGRKAGGAVRFLGRYHTQVSALREGREQEFMGWLSLGGGERYSKLNIYLSKLLPEKFFGMSTALNGSPRALVPVPSYEEVMPLDILPLPLMRALLVGDTDSAQQLGCLELEEEDVALLSYVCPGKIDYAAALRKNLTKIEQEG